MLLNVGSGVVLRSSAAWIVCSTVWLRVAGAAQVVLGRATRPRTGDPVSAGPPGAARLWAVVPGGAGAA